MTMDRRFALGLVLLACGTGILLHIALREPLHPRAKAAQELTAIYAASRLAGWHIKASAIDRSQQTLLIVVQQPLDDSTVEALHFAPQGSVYDVTDDGRGIIGFAMDHGFASVVWRDERGREWPFGVRR